MTDILAQLPFEKTEPFLDLYAWYLLDYKSLQVGKNIFYTKTAFSASGLKSVTDIKVTNKYKQTR
jgi:hypothetical protein